MASTALTALSALATRTTGTIPTSVMNARISLDVISFYAITASRLVGDSQCCTGFTGRNALCDVILTHKAHVGKRATGKDTEKPAVGVVTEFVPLPQIHCGRDIGGPRIGNQRTPTR